MIFPISQINDFINENKITNDIISIWGDFGTGKTILALQTAIIHAKLGEKVIYLYTKPNLPLEKVKSLIHQENQDILDDIIFLNTLNFNDLHTIIFNLEFLILGALKENNDMLNLIIIDSITDLYRIDLNIQKKDKNINLNYKLNQILGTLKFLHKTYDIEILLINELSHRSKETETIDIQSGGKVMDYWVSNSIKLTRTQKIGERELIINFGKQNEVKFTFNLSEQGFQDILR